MSLLHRVLTATLGDLRGRLPQDGQLTHLATDPKELVRKLDETRQSLSRLHLDPDFRPKLNPPWWVDNASEPNVQLHAREFLNPGDVALDIGANIGQLTQVMSRLVGPRGLIVAFEANEATLSELTNNLVRNVHINCWPVYAAVMRESGQWFDIEDHGAASVVVDGGERAAVPSVAIDDFVASHALAPSFIKLDIEGNEIHALDGAWRCIDRDRPVIVFEHNIGNDAALQAIQAHGYAVFCSAQHSRVRTSADCLPGASQRNLVAVHETRLAATRFARAPTRIAVAEMAEADLSVIEAVEDGAAVTFGASLPLPAGRYLLSVEAEAGNDATLYLRVRARGMVRQHWTAAPHFLRNERDMAFDLSRPETVHIEFAELAPSQTLRPRALRVERLDF